MKKRIIALMSIAFLSIVSCSKKDDDKDPLVGEWVAEKVVSNGVDLGINECTQQTRVSISEKHFDYYTFYNRSDNSECLSVVTSYDYVKENNIIKNVETSGTAGFYYSLEENNTRLRISQSSSNYVIFKRK